MVVFETLRSTRPVLFDQCGVQLKEPAVGRKRGLRQVADPCAGPSGTAALEAAARRLGAQSQSEMRLAFDREQSEASCRASEALALP
jgi:hypothetical protein